MLQPSKIVARRREPGVGGAGAADFAAPIAFSSVSAYRFWLTFIIVVAMSRSGGDCDSTSTRRGSGAHAMVAPLRQLPPAARGPRCRAAISARTSACAK